MKPLYKNRYLFTFLFLNKNYNNFKIKKYEKTLRVGRESVSFGQRMSMRTAPQAIQTKLNFLSGNIVPFHVY